MKTTCASLNSLSESDRWSARLLIGWPGSTGGHQGNGSEKPNGLKGCWKSGTSLFTSETRCCGSARFELCRKFFDWFVVGSGVKAPYSRRGSRASA